MALIQAYIVYKLTKAKRTLAFIAAFKSSQWLVHKETIYIKAGTVRDKNPNGN
jgi:hypothetical protein